MTSNSTMSRNLTIPNIITVIRLMLLPVAVIIANNNLIYGAITVAILGITDMLDGYIARHYNQESNLGRILDPIADRALTLTSFITFLILGAIPIAYVVLVGLRELIVAIGTLVIASRKTIRLDVNKLGKISAFGAMAATPLWVISYATQDTLHSIWLSLALVATVIAVITGYYSLIQYYRAYKMV